MSKIGLRFGKEWQEDILSLGKQEMFSLFKKVCIQLAILEKDFKDAKEEIKDLKKELEDLKKGTKK